MPEKKKLFPLAFTSRYGARVNVLKTNIGITPISPKKLTVNGKIHSYGAIWDTGATNSVITSKIVKDLALKPVGKVEVHGVNSSEIVSKYLVDFFLPNNVVMPGIMVSETEKLSSNSDILIGMDIIARGDLSITHRDNKTVFSFQLPATHDTDYVAETNKLINAGKKKIVNASSRKEYEKSLKRRRKKK